MLNYIFAYTISILGAHFVLGPVIRFMHRTSGAETSHPNVGRNKKNYRWQDLWVGGTERAIVTTLVITSPQHLPLFIGGWVAAKLAAGWSRFPGPEYASANAISLVGSALSISAAIGAGMLASPNFLATLNAVK